MFNTKDSGTPPPLRGVANTVKQTNLIGINCATSRESGHGTAKNILDKYVKLSNGKVGKVIRIRSQLRGKIAEVEINPPDGEYKYELAAVDKEQTLKDARFKNLLHIIEVMSEL